MSSAKMLQASQVFSQAQRRVNFIGRVDVALATCAAVTRITHDTALVRINLPADFYLRAESRGPSRQQ